MEKVALLEEFKEERETEVGEKRRLWRDLKAWLWGKKKDKEAKRQGYQALKE